MCSSLHFADADLLQCVRQVHHLALFCVFELLQLLADDDGIDGINKQDKLGLDAIYVQRNGGRTWWEARRS